MSRAANKSFLASRITYIIPLVQLLIVVFFLLLHATYLDVRHCHSIRNVCPAAVYRLALWSIA